MKLQQVKRGIRIGLAALTVLGMALASGNEIKKNPVYAAGKAAEIRSINVNVDGRIAGLSTTGYTSGWNHTDGIKVYFGQYDGTPTAYRLLRNEDGTVLLDCDTILISDYQFDSSNEKWPDCEARRYLNSGLFYAKANVLSPIEKAAIMETSSHGKEYTIASDTYKDFESSENIFLLSAFESDALYADNDARKKGNVYWLRSNGGIDLYRGTIRDDGSFSTERPYSGGVGISPAFNLSLDAIHSVTAVGTDKSSAFTAATNSSAREWRLTLTGGTGFAADRKESGSVMAGEDVIVTVSNIGTPDTGVTYTQLSAMLVDANGTVVAYGKIGEISDTGDIAIPISEDTEPGNYTLKLYAEDVNSSAGANLTDYASNVTDIPLVIEHEYNITVHDDGNGTADADTDLAASGTTITLTVTPKPGYQFKEWRITEGSITISNHQFTMPASDVTIQAIFEKIPVVTTATGEEGTTVTEAPGTEVTTETTHTGSGPATDTGTTALEAGRTDARKNTPATGDGTPMLCLFLLLLTAIFGSVYIVKNAIKK